MTISHERALEIYQMKKQGYSNLVIMKTFKISYSELQSAINYWGKKKVK